MILRQIFDRTSCTYTYLVASGGEACLIDPVFEQVEGYIRLLRELRLSLVMAVDTHLHADHVTGLGTLHARTRCLTVMGEQTAAEIVLLRVGDGDRIHVGDLELRAIHTPGHTDDSYCFRLSGAVLTGDTLLIRGTGRTDFQNGDPAAQYESLFNKLLRLPEDTRVYPGHDYNGHTVSTIGEEQAHNPRLQVGSVSEYVDLMHGLNLPRPKMMDVAVPANMRLGLEASSSSIAARAAV
jgi:glyoxylase-like metal-dependent hydrolase (beta-lactamase superfamily II)